MARYTCWKCGSGYDGAFCSVCAINKQAEKSAEQATRDQERATAATERALEEQTREITEALERANAAAEESAYETQMAIERAAEEHKRTTADAWKLQSRSKSEQARNLMDSGMLSEALDLALQAIRQDPSNFDGFVIASSVLNQQRKYEAVRTYVEKQIQLLSHPEHRTEPVNFLTVSYQVGSDGELRGKVCKAIEHNIDFWERRRVFVDDRVESIVKEVSSWNQFQTALVAQRWLLRNLGFTGQSLASARKLVLMAAGSPAGAEPLRKEFEQLARWISGEDKGDDSRMSKNAATRRPLVALVLAEEIYALIGTNKRLIPGFLHALKTTDREKLEGDLCDLRELSTQKDFRADAFSSVQHEVAGKYSAWQREIQEQLYDRVKTEVDSKPNKTHGFVAGLVAFFILSLVPLLVNIPVLVNHGTIPESQNPTAAFGALLGAILFGVASKTVEKSIRHYRSMRDGLDHAVARTNQRFCELGLPTIPAPTLRVQPPRLSIEVYAVLLCSYLGLWVYAIVPRRRQIRGQHRPKAMYLSREFN